MRFLILIIFISYSTFSKAQTISQHELDSMYVTALNNRFDLLLQSEPIYVEVNEISQHIRNLEVSDRYQLLSSDELIKLCLKQKQSVKIIRFLHQQISADTVDIDFEYGTAYATRRWKLHFHKGLRFRHTYLYITINKIYGEGDHLPGMRFAFNEKKKRWELIYNASSNSK